MFLRPILEMETAMKSRWKVFATATLAHGGVPDGHSEQGSGLDWSILLVSPSSAFSMP